MRTLGVQGRQAPKIGMVNISTRPATLLTPRTELHLVIGGPAITAEATNLDFNRLPVLRPKGDGKLEVGVRLSPCLSAAKAL